MRPRYSSDMSDYDWTEQDDEELMVVAREIFTPEEIEDILMMESSIGVHISDLDLLDDHEFDCDCGDCD